MGIYSVDKLISETRRIAREYRIATGKVLPVTPEIAINDAVSILNMLPNSESLPGYDAIYNYEGEALKVQIKGRAVFNEKRQGHRIGQLKLDQAWDAIVLVILNSDFMPEEIYMAKREVLLSELKESQLANKKGPMTIAKFKLISDLIWTAHDALGHDSLLTSTAS